MKNANVRKPSRRLTREDAVTIWKRRLSGEFQHRIAADLDVNPGRVNEVIKGHRFPEAEHIARASFH